MLLIKAIFYSPEGISFSSWSMNMRALVKALILTTGIFLSLVWWNYYSLNAPNFRRLYYNFRLTRAKNAGPKTMAYLSFWLIYILIWCNLCIFCVNRNNLKTAHSKMEFWDSLKKHWLKQNFNVWITSTTTTKKEYKRFFNNRDSIFVLLGVREELENFLNFNKRSGEERGGNFEKC